MRRANVLEKVRVIYSHIYTQKARKRTMRVYKVICKETGEHKIYRKGAIERVRVKKDEKLLMARMCKTRNSVAMGVLVQHSMASNNP